MKRKPINLYDYSRQIHKEKEAQRLKALANGEKAEYGYFKGFKTYTIPEEYYNDVPLNIYSYSLEMTYQQANEAIADGAETINLIIKHNNKYYLTYKNALKLSNFTLIKDVNGTYVIYYNNMFYKIPYLLICNIIIILLFALKLRWCFLFASLPLMIWNVWHFSKNTS